jgi:hypothetical protein
MPNRTHHHLSLIWLLLFLLFVPAACQFVPALPAPDPGPTATPLVTEGIAGSGALAYNLGMATIPQSWSSESPELPVPLLGAISVPEGEGPFPVALVFHGRHPRCTSDPAQLEEVWPCEEGAEPRYDIGFSYLLDALAARGFLAVAPSLNGAYTTTFDLGQGSLAESQPRVDERMTAIIAEHLARLAAANGGEAVFAEGLDLTGKVDSARVVTMAHSTSGITANKLARDGALPIKAQVLLAAMHFEGTGETADVPTAVVLSACDGDRPDLPAQIYYESARGGGRANPLFSALLEGANHNFYNQELARQGIDDGQFARNPTCALARVSGEAQQSFLAALAGAFFDATLIGADRPAWLNVTQPVAADLYGQPVQSALSPPAAQRRTLLTGQPVIAGPLTATLCPSGEPCAEGLFQPGLPGGVRLSWAEPGGEFSVDLSSVGEPYDTLRLRVALDPTDALNPPGEPISFSVVLTDRAGNSAEVEVPPLLPVLRGTYEGDDFRFSPVLPRDIRLPLAQFAGVDAASPVSATLRFDRSPTGSVLLVDWELVRGDAR